MKLKFLILPVVLGTLLISSCEKKTDCQLEVKCVNANGIAMQGVNVKLYANVKTSSGSTVEADLKAQGVSDGSGITTYTFKLPAILDISAVSGTLTGQGIIKLEEGKKVEKTITVK